MAEVSFGEWLKRRRNAAGLTQEQLASQLNCSTSALRKFESEERRPSAEIVEQLAELFSIAQEERKSFLRFARGDWQAISGGEVAEAPWQLASTDVAPRSNLPASITSFLGREKEQAEIIHLIAKNRLVTLTGTGGVGKTRLSLEPAHGMLNAFPDGIWFIELAPLSDPALVPQVIVNTLGLIEQAGRSPLNILTDYLKTKKSLFLLDNCEHLLQACARLVETLLRACPDLKILATSREALSIDGEILYLVPSLVTPDSQHTTIDTLTDYEAVQLFIERAQTALPNFSMTRDNAPAIAQVCQRLDGIPLALELAAARVKLLRVEEIAARLDDRFHLLTRGARTALPHHQTLQAMIDWSHDLLTEPEQVIFRRLSVFAGGWTLEAAESVCAEKDEAQVKKDKIYPSSFIIHPSDVLDLLTSLVNKSLVIAERRQGQETRYQILETIRQYGRDKLWHAGEGEMIRQPHLAYFVDVAERVEPSLRAFDMVMWLDRLEAELDNIRAALEWAHESDIEAQLRLASALLWFWHIRGHKNEGCKWLEDGLSVETHERGEGPLLPTRALIRAKALYTLGFLRLMSGEFDVGAELSEESLRLFGELGMAGKRGMAYALWNMSVVADTKQDFNRQKALLEEAFAVFEELGDKFGTAQCLMGLGFVAMHYNDYEQARMFIEDHLALRKEIGDMDGVAIAFDDLGFLAASQGNYEQAQIHYEASLSLFRELKNKWAMSWVLSDVGAAALAQGDFEQATKIFEEARIYLQGVGDTRRSTTILIRLGSVARSKGDYGRATQLLENALALFRHSEEKVDVASALRHLGLTAFAQGSDRLAERRFEETLMISREIGEKIQAALALYGLGRVAQAQGDFTSARARYTEGIMIHREKGIVAQHLEGFALLAVAQNYVERAARLFSASQALHPPFRFEMSARERDEHDQAIATLRGALGEEAFGVAWEEGKKINLDEAIKYALEENND